MSRSRKHTPIIGNTTSESEKQDKRIANRKLRRKNKVLMREDDELFLSLKEVSNVWMFDKDGKNWFNEDNHPKLMRK